jgi:hypothetical protein
MSDKASEADAGVGDDAYLTRDVAPAVPGLCVPHPAPLGASLRVIDFRLYHQIKHRVPDPRIDGFWTRQINQIDKGIIAIDFVDSLY